MLSTEDLLGIIATEAIEPDPNAIYEPSRRKETLVFAGGCFDLLHFGHLMMLARARALGDRLIVGLNTDESIRGLKGPGRPIISYFHRYECLKAVRWVDDVIPIVDSTPVALIRQMKPEVVVKGPGYDPGRMPEAPIVESYGGRIVILDGPDISTTSILERLRNVASVPIGSES